MSLSILSLLMAGSTLLQFTASAPAPPAPSQQSTVTGPLLQQSFADPALIDVNGTYYTFATSGDGMNFPMASSSSLGNMKWLNQDAMPTLPAWAVSNATFVWAPNVIQFANGNFVLYFSAASNQDKDRHCVGVATSNIVTGPYTPQSSPFACPLDQHGAIDPAGFIDNDSKVYVVYKVDGNSLGGGGPCGNQDGSHATPHMLQEILTAPTYVLFFSNQCYNGALYNTSYATSTNGVTGPYKKTNELLLLTGLDGLNSPGGTDVLADGSAIVFHEDQQPSNSDVRQMYSTGIQIDGTSVSLVSHF